MYYIKIKQTDTTFTSSHVIIQVDPPPDSLRETVYFLIVSCCFFEGRLGVPFSIWSDLQFETRDKEVIRQNMTAGFEQNNM